MKKSITDARADFLQNDTLLNDFWNGTLGITYLEIEKIL